MSLAQRMRRLEEVRTKLLADYQHVCQTVKDSKTNLRESKELTGHIETAQVVLQESAKTVQQRAHTKISKVVSRCLETVFEDPYEFRITFEKKRGRTEAKLTFVRGELEVSPLKAAGGGVVDVASFGLRLACLMLSKPSQRKIIIADEPFKHVSVRFRARVRELMEVLSEELGIQFVLVTHSERLRIGKVLEVVHDGTEAKT